ncbi:TetR/AcrR family transcriptional regulator [uncultured Massilia sp.]|uniref:TetR/AcrR family transcriptional regulator n=1 Tax=uncultured Massilia sp. TaxID=169973 RepID=UPI0025DA2AD5|nr:TetR/AcrR family transcriptional regulator [uncultured Massilia sp.]
MAGTRQFDEDEVLDRALRLFWRRGFGATSMQDIAQATGVLRGSLYHAYGDKQAIFLRIFARYRAWFLDGVRAALAAPAVDAALRDYLRFSIETVTAADDDAMTRGCLTSKTALDETAMDDAIRAALRGLLDGVRALLEERLARPDARGRLALAPAAAARLLVTSTRGLVVMERVYRDKGELQAVADDLLALLVPDTARPD